MSVFVWPTPFRALAKCNQRGIDKDYGPTGHSGCAERSGLALAAGTETYILRHSGKCWHTETYTNARRHTHTRACTNTCSERLTQRQQGEGQSPNIRSKCLTQLNPS